MNFLIFTTLFLASFASATYDYVSKIQEMYPNFQNPNFTDFERTSMIRKWAWSKIVYADSPLSAPSSWYSLSVPDKLQAFEDNAGGVYCGGSARLLYELYRDLGYKSWYYNFGNPASYTTHVVTIVEIYQNGKNVKCVQDAYFNTAITDGNGNCVDLLEMLSTLMNGNYYAHEKFNVSETDWRTMPDLPRMLYPNSTSEATLIGYFNSWWPVLVENYTITFVSSPFGSVYAIRSPRTYTKFLSLSYNSDGSYNYYLLWLVSNDYPPSLFYLYTLPLGMAGYNASLYNEILAISSQTKCWLNESACNPTTSLTGTFVGTFSGTFVGTFTPSPSSLSTTVMATPISLPTSPPSTYPNHTENSSSTYSYSDGIVWALILESLYIIDLKVFG